MILFITRKTINGQFSIQKIFRLISSNFNDSRIIEMPFKSTFLGVFANSIFIIFLRFRHNSKTIFHVTGDVHYLCIFLPYSRSILTIHDLYGARNFNGIKRLYFNLLWIYLPIRSVKYITTPSILIKRQINILIKLNKSTIIEVIENPILYEENSSCGNYKK
jgi:hypothetical protein